MGEVDLEIGALAKELQADLIVMGCRGHRGIRRTIEGSISYAVIRHAPCPVLVVRSHESAQDPKRSALSAQEVDNGLDRDQHEPLSQQRMQRAT